MVSHNGFVCMELNALTILVAVVATRDLENDFLSNIFVFFLLEIMNF